MAVTLPNIQSLARSPITASFGLALLTSIGLFWLMHSFIGAGGHGADAIEAMPAIDFVRLRRDTQMETLDRRKPPPPPPEPPPPPQRIKVAAEAVQQDAAPTPFAIPNLGLSTNVGGGPFVGELGGGGGAASSLFDGDIIPLQRVAPRVSARRRAQLASPDGCSSKSWSMPTAVCAARR